MIRQIEEKVINRLRQVTSAIKQAGANQVSVITSSAEREAAVEFAKAATIRPATVDRAFQEIAREPQVAEARFDVLETQRILASKSRFLTLPTAECWRIGWPRTMPPRPRFRARGKHRNRNRSINSKIRSGPRAQVDPCPPTICICLSGPSMVLIRHAAKDGLA